MAGHRQNILTLVNWSPAGLITWYGSQGKPLALAIPWVALVGGETPTLRAAWPEHQDLFSPDGAFILNVPGDSCLPLIARFVDSGVYCLDIVQDLQQEISRGVQVDAPCLPGCAIQVECRNGLIGGTVFDAEISGEVVLIRRWMSKIVPGEIDDIRLIELLNPKVCPVQLQ